MNRIPKKPDENSSHDWTHYCKSKYLNLSKIYWNTSVKLAEVMEIKAQLLECQADYRDKMTRRHANEQCTVVNQKPDYHNNRKGKTLETWVQVI